LPLEAGETAELDIENHIDIISIALTSAESFLPDAKARIYELSTGPASVPPLTNIIYKYWQIISEHSRENEPFSKVEIKFRVNKQWSDRHSVDMNTLRLNRYDNGWTALPTKFTGEDSNYYYFVGESPGLSLFGVNATAKKLIVTPVTPPVIKVTYAPTNILFLLLFALMSLYLLHKRYHGKFGWWRRKHHTKLSIKNQFSWWPQE
jgi:PGF-pre-PGF domain-containing protein